MDTDKINKLKECKELLDQGVLTQQEFEEEKKKILSSEQHELNNRQSIILSEQPIECVAETIPSNDTTYKIAPVPLEGRRYVMKCSTPQEATNKFDRFYKRSILAIVLGGILIALFIYQSGFWAVFFAVFWALAPGIALIITGLVSLGRWRDMRDRFAKMSQQEFNLVQLDIEQRRQNMVNATGEFVNSAQQSYSEATGGRNMWFDIGSAIGSRL